MVPSRDSSAGAALACWRCGFDLRTQTGDAEGNAAAVCPECGLAVADTLAAGRRLLDTARPARTRWAATFGLAAFLLPLICGVLGGTFLGTGGTEVLEIVLLTGAVLAACLMLVFAAHCAANPGPLGRGAIGLAWAVAGCTLAGTVLLVTGSHNVRHPQFITGMASALTAYAAAMFLLPTILLSLRRRVRSWPHATWLPGRLHTISVVMYAAAGCLWACAGIGWILDASNLDASRAYDVFHLVTAMAGLLYFLCVLAWLALLVVVAVGARRAAEAVAMYGSHYEQRR